MSFKTIFFDLDDTIYPSSCGLWDLIKDRIELYMQIQLKLNPHEIPVIRKTLFTKYGTTMRGLQQVYGIDERDYLKFVHDVPVEEFLNPDQELLELLQTIEGEKYIFTNADTAHAERVLRRLGIFECFTSTIDILALSPFCKPQKEAFTRALESAKVDEPCHCLMIDDSTANTIMARSLGMKSILVGVKGDPATFDHHISHIHELVNLLPDL
jgi:putative hydrolase of the HAD superfamily